MHSRSSGGEAQAQEESKVEPDPVVAPGSGMQLRGLSLRNRIVISPMCMYSAQDGLADDFHLAHLGRFAMGGAALVFVEATAIHPAGRITHGCVGLWKDSQVAGLARVAALLQRVGSKAGIQLNHSGRKGSSHRPWDGGGPLTAAQGSWQTVGATTEAAAEGAPAAHALTLDEIAVLLADFAAAAARADRAGFDVLELHFAHGYLVHQFLSPLSNTRSDAYGGSLAGRMRFALEVVESVRTSWPEHKPLFVRVSSIDGVDVGWSLADTIVLARLLKERGVDVIDCSSGGMNVPRAKQLVTRTPGFHLPFSEAVRRQAGIPTVAVGQLREPALVRRILAEGRADLIAVAREALFNPNWAHHLLLATAGASAWSTLPQPHGWWLQRRAEQDSRSAV